MTRYAIGLGSNQGDRLANLMFAVDAVGALGSHHTVSGVYETEPIGGPEQGPYLNAVMVIESPLDPEELLEQLHRIEAGAGREREIRWGPRTLDLDIIAKEGPPWKSRGLVVPHPRAAQREFVLRPLVEIWPDALVAEATTAVHALGEVSGQEIDLLARDWVVGLSDRPGKLLVGVQFAWFLGIGIALAFDGSLPGDDVSGTRVLGAVMTVLGLIFAFLSTRRLGASMTAVPEPKEGGRFVDSGFYRLVRHPIYGGVVLWLLGTSLFLDSLVGSLLSLGLVVFFYAKSEYEERRLRIAYPEYRAYRQKVKHRMIPFVF
ncbi:MAG: 2-amino-4-hydroxy-6-hydroxymethyldihydropteridine diphosphokinase [Acidimicrobiia bacterium]|nr:2-amino-4-hydroxy-6-hydroxymethyldihydropteridine diphosphokinase [Acidimicrobiia bacterium]